MPAGIYGHIELTLDGTTAQKSTVPRNTTALSLGGKHDALLASLRSKAGTATKVSSLKLLFTFQKVKSQVHQSCIISIWLLGGGNWRQLATKWERWIVCQEKAEKFQ